MGEIKKKGKRVILSTGPAREEDFEDIDEFPPKQKKKCANCGQEIEYTGTLPTLCQVCWNKLHGRGVEG